MYTYTNKTWKDQGKRQRHWHSRETERYEILRTPLSRRIVIIASLSLSSLALSLISLSLSLPHISLCLSLPLSSTSSLSFISSLSLLSSPPLSLSPSSLLSLSGDYITHVEVSALTVWLSCWNPLKHVLDTSAGSVHRCIPKKEVQNVDFFLLHSFHDSRM